MGQAYIEKGVMECGVDKTEQEDEPPVGALSDVEVLVGGTCHGQHQQSGNSKPDAGEEHLAARHLRRYLKLGIAQLDQRIGKAPGNSRSEGKQRHPERTLEDGYVLLCHRV